MGTWDTDRLGREIAALERRTESPYALRVEAMERLAEAVPVDGWCFSTADPESLMMTSHATRDIDRSRSPLIHMNEYGEPDVGKHADLAAAEFPVQVLSRATHGDPARSPRYRRVLRPLGLEHELRAAVRERGLTWGFLHLFRTGAAPDFTADEAVAVERFARLVAPLLRRALVGRVSPAPARSAPSLVLLDERNRLVEGTPGGNRWADALRDPELGPDAVPEAFVTLAIWARSLTASGSDAVARTRIPGAGGEWFSASGVCTDRGRVAIILQPAQPAEMAGLLFSHHGLTPAERQVAEAVLGGRSTREIADDLFLSPHTVQDHLKAIFAKTGVRSRRDLVARLSGAA